MDHFVRLGCASTLSTLGPLTRRQWCCCYGFPQQPFGFDAVASRLNAAGLRTLTPTQRGYTPAARPTRRRDYRTSATAADVVALLDTAGLAQAHIVGHDWGGSQAWGTAGWHADRVVSLTVLSTRTLPRSSSRCGPADRACSRGTWRSSNCLRCRSRGPGDPREIVAG